MGHDISRPILHRIVYVIEIGDRVYYQTSGDNSPLDDWFVPSEGVLGKTILIFPRVGNILLLMERIEVKLFLILLIAFMFFILPKLRTMEKWQTLSARLGTLMNNDE